MSVSAKPGKFQAMTGDFSNSGSDIIIEISSVDSATSEYYLKS
jgi:hypothetical protein